MNVWMANTVDDFATVESYVSQNIAPGASWFDGGNVTIVTVSNNN